jgi:hypothetical protein
MFTGKLDNQVFFSLKGEGGSTKSPGKILRRIWHYNYRKICMRKVKAVLQRFYHGNNGLGGQRNIMLKNT